MTIEAALELAAAGLPIFPCGRDKRPLVAHWRQDATTDATRIREWWRAHTEAMIGLPTGQASGLYVVDLDVDKSTGEALGEGTLAALGLSYLLEGPRVNTPSGGLHLFFRWPGEGFGNTAKRLGPGIDTRGEGGFVIAAGSCNGLGEYIAQGDWRNPPDLPEALREHLGRPPQEASPPQEARHAPATNWGEAALREELARVLAAPEGGRNDALNRATFRLAQVVAGGNLDAATAAARLAGAAAAIGLPAQEAQRTIESGMAAGMASPRGPEPRPGGPVVRSGGPPEGPQPLLREIPPGAAYPVEALGPLRAAVEAVAGVTQAPVAIAGASALSLASLAVQAHGDVETLAGPRPVSVFALTVARSGERKSTVDSALSKALRAFEVQEAKAHTDAQAAWANQWAIWDATRRSLIAAAAKGGSDRDKRANAEADLAALGREPAAPMVPGRTVSEPTFEGIARALREGCPSLGVFSDEGAQFLGGFTMSPDNRQKTLAALNLLWDGAPIKRTRAGEGVYVLHGRRLALHLLVQPHAAHALLADPLAGDLGFLARCLICEPVSTIGARMQATAREPGLGLAQFSHRLFEALEAPLPMDPDTRALEPQTLPLSPDARALLCRYADHVEAAQRKGGEFEHVTAAASKSAEQASRVAGTLTLWADLHALEVSAETMADAIMIAQFYLGEAARLADAATVSVDIDRAERLRRWLLESWPHPEILPRDVLRLAPIRALRESPAAKKALEMLAAHGWLEALPEGAEVRGASRKLAYRIVRPGCEV